ncbi:MAG TPA: cytochrome c [Nitrospira sp.]|nr:cytochrome c [Nitrospira sp.]
MKRSAAVGTLIGGLLGIVASSLATPSQPALLEQGQVLYERHCADCHGIGGRGDGKQALSLSPRPGSLISAQTSARTDQDLLKIIANGRPRTAMEGWKDRLSDDEQHAVLAYLRSLVRFTKSATPPPPAP